MSSDKGQKARRIMMTFVVATMIPAVFMTVHIVRQSMFDNNVARFVKAELTQRGTQIISNNVDKDSLILRVVAVGKEIKEARHKEAQGRMEFYGLGNYQLRIIQGTQSDSLMLLNNELSVMTTSRESEQHQVAELSSQVHKLNNQLSDYTRYEALSKEIRSEISTLFPEVKSLSISRVAEIFSDTTTVSHHTVAIIGTSHGKPLPKAEAHKLRKWLKTRVKADSLVIVNSEQ